MTTIVCLNCARKFTYDIKAMTMGAEIPPAVYVKAGTVARSARVVEIAGIGRKNG